MELLWYFDMVLNDYYNVTYMIFTWYFNVLKVAWHYQDISLKAFWYPKYHSNYEM